MKAVNGILAQVRTLGMARVAMLAGVALGMLAAFIWLEMQGPLPGRMKLVASDLDTATIQQVTEELDRRKIPYRVDNSGALLVADGEVSAAKAVLAAKGISAEGTKGYEIFDQGSSLTLTDFDQQVRLTRALEGELSRTLEQVRGITRARVHLVLPRRQPFSHDQQEAQASVMLTFPGRQILSHEAVASVVTLVAAAVPGLKPQNVTVVDSNLHLLVQAGDENDPRLRSAQADEQRQQLEGRLSQEVELMLERSLGVGHVRAQASIRMNFDTINETQERFDPDSPVIRSTQNVTSNDKTTDRTGSVSVQNNLPNADAGAQTTGSQQARQEETTNYEISKTVRAVVHDQPRIERISLAVMVDGIDEVTANGKHNWRPRDAAELARIEKLVKTAIGYDEKRGDLVEVVSMPFINEVEAPGAAATHTTAFARNSDLITLLRIVGFGVVGFTIIILTARSILNALNRPPAALVAEGGADAGSTLLGLSAAGDGQLGIGQDGTAAGTGGTDDPETVQMKQIEGTMRASSIRKVIELAESQPDTALAIIRRWMAVEPN
ncbi:MAG TPA: flagellar basal-body MS-ring/collar protein FliF [Rhodopila sp.]|nr:flagellar basal-body MS-ring/collar protein FliF [Rhodopila sp.]